LFTSAAEFAGGWVGLTGMLENRQERIRVAFDFPQPTVLGRHRTKINNDILPELLSYFR
jgi:hypothetical protein